MKRIDAVLVLSVILLVGCAVSEPTATSMPTDTPPPTVTSTPSPTPTTGQVKGVLVNKSTDQAVTTARANLVPVEVGDDGAIVYSADLLAERTMSMGVTSGVFLFEDVKPGHYLITVNIGGGMPLNLEDDQGTRIVLHIEAGQVIDLGKLPVER
jgi:hypothetical protein